MMDCLGGNTLFCHMINFFRNLVKMMNKTPPFLDECCGIRLFLFSGSLKSKNLLMDYQQVFLGKLKISFLRLRMGERLRFCGSMRLW